MNALKTGIHAQSHITPGEDPAELNELTAQRFVPQGPEEVVLLDSMVSNAWELRRLPKAEAEIWDDGIEENIDSQQEWGRGREPHHLQGRAYISKEKGLDRWHNRIAAVERAFRASLDALLKLRKQALSLPTAPQPAVDETKPFCEASQPLNPDPAEPQASPLPFRTPEDPRKSPPYAAPGNDRLKI